MPRKPQEPRRPSAPSGAKPTAPSGVKCLPTNHPQFNRATQPPPCAQYENAYKRYKEAHAAYQRAGTLYNQQVQQHRTNLARYTTQLEKYTRDLQRYEVEKRHYEACRRCDRASDELAGEVEDVDRTEDELERAHRVIPVLQQKLATAKSELHKEQQRRPAIQEAKDDMDAEWLPQKEYCATAASDYKNGKNNFLQECAPDKYDQSCEKACMDLHEKQDYGSGIVEGLRPEEGIASGGLQVTCSPPQPSWILSPWNYGATPSTSEQCERIEASQGKPRYAQKVLKKGWLWKKGRVNGWDKRFFVLESGDKVRSGVLRYFEEDPFGSFSTWADIEKEDKGIILWDAKSTKAKTGENYNFEDGSECLKIYHFYRDFRLCVPGDTSKTGTNDGKSASEHREEWMQLIDAEIAHRY